MDAVTRCPNCGEPLEGEKLRVCPKCASSLPKDLLAKTKEVGGFIQELTDFPKSSGLTAQDGQALQERATAYKETYAKEIAAGDFEDFEWIETTAIKELTQLLGEFPSVIKKREAEIAENNERERKEAEEKAEQERKEAGERAERERKETEEKAERERKEAEEKAEREKPTPASAPAKRKLSDTIASVEDMYTEIKRAAEDKIEEAKQATEKQIKYFLNIDKTKKALDNKSLTSTAAGKSRIVAYVLLIFLGYFGAHQFYLGNKKAGILRLALLGAAGVGGTQSMEWFIGAGMASIAALWIIVLWFKDLFTLWRHVE